MKFPTTNTGMSLVELMIGLALSMFTLSTLIYLYTNASYHDKIKTAHASLHKTILYSQKLISNSLQQVNYLGNRSHDNYLTAGLKAQKSLSPCNNITDSLFLKTSLHASSITGLYYPCLKSKTSNYLKGDILHLRLAKMQSTGKLTTNRLYISNHFLSDNIFVAEAKTRVKSKTYPELAIHPIHLISYYIGSQKSVLCNNKKVPGLMQLSRSKSGKLRKQMLVLGLELLNYQFIIKTAKTKYQFKNTNQINNWNDIVGVRILGLARSHCKVYRYKQKQVFSEFNQKITYYDKYMRRAFSRLVYLRNVN